jgi:uncharacterized protein HemX
MSFGITAATWAAIGTAAVSAGAAYMGQQQQKKAGEAQKKALEDAAKKDALEAASAETNAAVAANQQLAATRKRRQQSALSLGAGDTLGATSVLGGGSRPVAVTSALSKGAS